MISGTQSRNIKPASRGRHRWTNFSRAPRAASKVSIFLFLVAALATGWFYGGFQASLVSPLVAEAALVSPQPLVSSFNGTGPSVSADGDAGPADDDGDAGPADDDDSDASKDAKDAAKDAKDDAKDASKDAKDDGSNTGGDSGVVGAVAAGAYSSARQRR